MFYNEYNSIYFSESNYNTIVQEYFQKKSKKKSGNSEKYIKDKSKKKDYSKERERKRSLSD